MPKEIARACLDSLEFIIPMPLIKRTFPIPSPAIHDNGPLHFCRPGYDPVTSTFVFESDFPPDPELMCRRLHGVIRRIL